MARVCKRKRYYDMIKAGKTRRQIKTIIDEHTYKGVRANLEFSKWSKTNV